MDILDGDDNIAIQGCISTGAGDMDSLAADVVGRATGGEGDFTESILVRDGVNREGVFIDDRVNAGVFHGEQLHCHGVLCRVPTIGGDVVIKEYAEFLIVLLLAREGLGHPRLYGQAAMTVRDIWEVPGVDVGGNVRATGGGGCCFRCRVPEGKDAVDEDAVLEIPVIRSTL